MNEQVELVLGQVRSAWRFRLLAVVVAWAIATAGWVAVFLIPSQYESSARVFVDTNSLLRPLLEGIAVQPSTSDQVGLVRRALLSRPQLEKVIAETDLRLRVRSDRGKEAMISALMKEISIDADASSARDREPNIYSIRYMDTDPHLSYTVVKGLLDALVEQSLGANRTDSDTAQRFIKGQLQEYERRLTESEERLAAFKRRNIGSMPDERGGYFERLQAEMTALDQVSAALNVAANKRDELRSKLSGGNRDGSNSAGAAPVETSVDGRIVEARSKLEELLLRFTDEHPDVLALKSTIARLEQQREEEVAALRSNRGALGAPRTGSTSLVVQNLQIALNEAELDVTSLRSQLADRQQRVASLRGHINTLPEVEAELLRLNRDYTVTRTEYEKLLQRYEQAKLSDAADRVDEVRFRIIDPPAQALVPAKPRRVLLVAGVLLLALGGGIGVAWLRAMMSPVVLTSADLVRLLPKAALAGQVDSLDSVGETSRGRKDWLLTGGAVGALVSAGILLMLLSPRIEGVMRDMAVSSGAA